MIFAWAIAICLGAFTALMLFAMFIAWKLPTYPPDMGGEFYLNTRIFLSVVLVISLIGGAIKTDWR